MQKEAAEKLDAILFGEIDDENKISEESPALN
jgi:hypothetical protein